MREQTTSKVWGWVMNKRRMLALTQNEIEKLIAKRDLIKARLYLRIHKLDRLIDLIIIIRNLEEKKQALKKLKEDPSASLFKYGEGGFLDEQLRQRDLKEKIKEIDKIIQESISDSSPNTKR